MEVDKIDFFLHDEGNSINKDIEVSYGTVCD